MWATSLGWRFLVKTPFLFPPTRLIPAKYISVIRSSNPKNLGKPTLRSPEIGKVPYELANEPLPLTKLVESLKVTREELHLVFLRPNKGGKL